MNKSKYIACFTLIAAITLTACDTEESALIPTEPATTVTEFETEVAETSASPSVTVTPVPNITETTTTVTVTSKPSETSEDITEGTVSYEDEDSEIFSSQADDNPMQTTVISDTEPVPTSEPESVPGSTRVPKPTEDTRYMKHASCCDCGNETLVYTPNYRYTTPERSHVETDPTWDYGIEHCEVQINWMQSSFFTDDEYYNGHFDERPTIKVPFDREVDTDGIPFNHDAERAATDEALTQAHAWLKSIGINEPRCSYQTNRLYTDKVNYQENPYTVIDEPEHEYECTAYICDTCGAVELDWRDVKQIR